MCDCGTETKTTEHLFLYCPSFETESQKLLNHACDKHFSSQNLNEKSMIDILLFLLYRCDRFNVRDNKEFLLRAICYIKSTNCLERLLIDQCLL